MKNVLIALDFKPSSQLVAETGYNLAKKLGANVALVHVLSDAPYYPIQYLPIEGFSFVDISNSMVVSDELHSHANDFLENMVKHLGQDVPVTTKLIEGETYGAILDFAKEWGADLLVVGSHERSGFARLFEGETAVKLQHHTKIPILVVPCDDK